MSHKNYIPNSKFDKEATHYLFQLPLEEIQKDVPLLLEWIQDLHWDVAHDIIKYFTPYVNNIAKELVFILNTNDGLWKYGVIVLASQSPYKLDTGLVNAIKRIAQQPTKIELEDDVDYIAKKVVANKLLCD